MTTQPRHPVPAVAWMAAGTATFSAMPLAVALTGGTEDPLAWNAWFRAGNAAACAAAAALLWRAGAGTNLSPPGIARRLVRTPCNWLTALMVLQTADLMLLGYAGGRMGIVPATVLFESWPIWTVILAALLFHGTRRYERIPGRAHAAMALALVGAAAAVAAQEPGLEMARALARAGPTLLIVAAAVAVAGLTTACWRWVHEQQSGEETPPGERALLTAMAFAVAATIAAGGWGAAAIAMGHDIHPATATWPILAGAVLAAGNIAWTRANQISAQLTQNAMLFAIGPLSVMAITAAAAIMSVPGHRPVDSWPLLTAGALIVAAVNAWVLMGRRGKPS